MNARYYIGFAEEGSYYSVGKFYGDGIPDNFYKWLPDKIEWDKLVDFEVVERIKSFDPTCLETRYGYFCRRNDKDFKFSFTDRIAEDLRQYYKVGNAPIHIISLIGGLINVE